MTTIRYGLCTFCDAGCGLEVEVSGRDVIAIRPDGRDPFSRGHLCPKGLAQQELYADPDRLRRPVRREGSQWHEISWEAAYAEVAERVVALQRRHGKDAVGFYFGNPVGHDYQALLSVLPLAKLLGTRNLFSSNSLDAHPRMLVSLLLYGNQALLPIPDLERTEHLVIMGANPVVSHGSVLTAPDTKRRLQEIRERGGTLVVIDPRRTETAKLADAHHFIRPGTDALLLLGVLHTIAKERGFSFGAAASLVRGEQDLHRLVERFPPARVADAVGIPAGTIRDIALAFADAPRAVWYGRMGTCTQRFGCLSTWLMDVVNLVTGNLDRPGGALFTTPAVDMAGLARRIGQPGDFGRWSSRVGGLPEFNGELPVAALADEIETPGDGQIRGMIIYAGNPVLSNPNGRRLEGALAGLELLTCVDYYVNETTRHAHLILPPVSPLESDHYPLLELAMGVRNVARYAQAPIPAEPGAKSNAAIALELLAAIATARGGLGTVLGAATGVYGKLLHSGRVLDLLLRLGPHHLSLKQLKAAPHGLDLGPLEPRLSQVLYTRDGRIPLIPALLEPDLERLDRLLQAPEAKETSALLLVSRRTLKSMNSWLHNCPRLVRGKPRCTLMIHPSDARARQLGPGATAVVASRIGTIRVPVEITDEMMPGTVSLPFGWGHHRDGTRLSVAREHAGVSMNDVVDERDYDHVSGTSVLDGIPVHVTAVSDEATKQGRPFTSA